MKKIMLLLLVAASMQAGTARLARIGYHLAQFGIGGYLLVESAEHTMPIARVALKHNVDKAQVQLSLIEHMHKNQLAFNKAWYNESPNAALAYAGFWTSLPGVGGAMLVLTGLKGLYSDLVN